MINALWEYLKIRLKSCGKVMENLFLNKHIEQVNGAFIYQPIRPTNSIIKIVNKVSSSPRLTSM